MGDTLAHGCCPLFHLTGASTLCLALSFSLFLPFSPPFPLCFLWLFLASYECADRKMLFAELRVSPSPMIRFVYTYPTHHSFRAGQGRQQAEGRKAYAWTHRKAPLEGFF